MTIIAKLNALASKADHLHSCIEDNCDYWKDPQDALDEIKEHLDNSINVLESIGAQVEGVKYLKSRNIFEVIADISMIAGGLMADGRIEVEDSREFINSVLPDLAQQFDDSYTPEQEEQGLYMELVEEFAIHQLTELYGTLKEDETIELSGYHGKTYTANAEALEAYLITGLDYEGLEEFLDVYTFDDTDYLLQHAPSIFE